MKKKKQPFGGRIFMLLLILTMNSAIFASSHREAPLIANDPLADNVDLYAFRSPDNPDMITIIATYVPMQLPYGGPNYYSFGENVRYEIHVDNDPSIPGDEVTYRFTFHKMNEDPTTFFNIRLGKQNLKTSYTMERSLDGGMTFETIIENGIVPPPNVGPRSINGAAGLNTDYRSLFQQAIMTASTGENVYAGPADDPFFVDLGGIFDLGNAPRQSGKPVDGLACFNVSAIAIQVPISTLRKVDAPSEPETILDGNYVIGVWASASRQAIRTLSSDSTTYSGEWVQVSRLGMPLTNEAVIPIGMKDYWNSITPYDELGDTLLDPFFFNPELGLYMDDDLFGGAVPALAPLRIQSNSLGSFDFTNGADGLYGLKGSDAVAGTALDDAVFGSLLLPGPGMPRSVDLWPAFHTGVPNVVPYQLATGKEGNPLAAGKPFVHNFLPNGGDMLRLNMAVPPTPRTDPNFSSLGLVQAAAIGLTVPPFNTTTDLEFIPNMDGFPNGRRLEDDVTRIELQAVSGVVLAAVGLWYDDFTAESESPVTQQLLNVLTYSTGVESNDKPFMTTFPYLALPSSGTDNCFQDLYDGKEAIDTLSTFFASSNNAGKIGVYYVLSDGTISSTQFASAAQDADGIYYDEQRDVLYQLNRSENVINAYSQVIANLNQGAAPVLTATSSSDFINGREITVSGSNLVVAQDATEANGNTNMLHIYNITPSSISYVKGYEVNFNLWGIQCIGDTLYAIVDNTNQLVRYDNFFSRSDNELVVSNSLEIKELVRTHGLNYNSKNDIMVLTDVGAAESAEDGAFVVITDYKSKTGDDEVSVDEQIRIEGPLSQLGNPVDVALDMKQGLIYIAERAQMGGKILAFSIPNGSGDASPIYVDNFAGASAVFLNGNEASPLMTDTIARFYGSSNTAGEIGVFDVQSDFSLQVQKFMSVADDADGIYYDEINDVLYQLNRTDNVINAYSNVRSSVELGMTPMVTATSTSDFTNGREIAVSGDKLVVVQDASEANGMANRLVVYSISPTSITLDRKFDVSINLWGIYADVNTLYAIEDNSDRVAVFNNFFSNTDSMIQSNQSIVIEDMGRTHGITYVQDGDILVLTDVNEASSDSDGAYTIITDFSDKAMDGMIDLSEQQLVEGDQTQLGNPVDIAYDVDNQLIYIAERANDGGKILVFDALVEGNIAPVTTYSYPGASAIYLEGSVSQEDPTTYVIETTDANFELDVFPNPALEKVNIAFKGEPNLFHNTDLEILTIEGKVIRQISNIQNFSNVSVHTLQAGHYLLVFKNDLFEHTVKLNKI